MWQCLPVAVNSTKYFEHSDTSCFIGLGHLLQAQNIACGTNVFKLFIGQFGIHCNGQGKVPSPSYTQPCSLYYIDFASIVIKLQLLCFCAKPRHQK